MQKFTRALTREINLANERLAVTLSEQGIALRPVGSRKPPWELTWSELVCWLTGRQSSQSKVTEAEDLAHALKLLKQGSATQTESETTEAAAPGLPFTTPAQSTEVIAPETMRSLLDRLEHWLSQHRPRFLQGLQPGASTADLEALETAVGVSLPQELRELLAWHNGQREEFTGFLEESWNLLSTNQIAAAKRHLDSGPAGEGVYSGWQPRWLPFLSDGSGNYLCIDTGEQELPVRALWQEKTTHEIVSPSVRAWLQDFVTAVERGDYYEDEERGHFLRTTR